MGTPAQPKIWWSNISFFLGTHIAALVGVYYKPLYALPFPTICLTLVSWQLACFGITIGYHRLYSHKSFRACLGLRIVLAALGTSAHQGSIRWWCLRHRLHHRFTDDPIHDPYSATRGLVYSHVGWIFFKPTYGKLNLIQSKDLDTDPVVRIQHKYYHLLAVLSGFVVPSVIAWFWNDIIGGFLWGGLVARVLVWHCTFLINSLAHWKGLQPYSDANTSRGNLILALLTCGEGNHNFWIPTTIVNVLMISNQHAFPHDYRSGPSAVDWDPSKWAILLLKYLGLATKLRRAKEEDINDGLEYMRLKDQGLHLKTQETGVPIWTRQKLEEYLCGDATHLWLLLIDGYVVDATSYLTEHPGGAKLLGQYRLKSSCIGENQDAWTDASNAYHGGMNIHSWAANRKMQRLRIAVLDKDTHM